MLCNLQCPVGLNQREICAHFNEGNLAQFGRSAKKLRIVELRGRKLAQHSTNRTELYLYSGRSHTA